MTVLSRIRRILPRKGPLIALVATLFLAFVAPFFPLLDVPGIESALFANGLLVILCGILGIAAAREEIQGQRQGTYRSGSSLSSTGKAFCAAALPALALLVFLAGWTSAKAALAGNCSPTAGLIWYLVLPAPTLLLATGLGLLLGMLGERRRLPYLGYLLFLAFSLLTSLAPIWKGPQVFFYDHFFGYLPGPLYDELVTIGRPLLTFRLLTLFWALLAFSAAALARRRWQVGADRSIVPALAGCSLALVAVLSSHGSRFDLGYERSSETLAAALGGKLEGERCTLFHPSELPGEEAAKLLAECDHRMEELESYFGVSGERAQVFLHRSREEKRFLVGAANTQFAKPWLSQIHIDRRGSPHPVLKHELAHLVTAKIGRRPFGVSATLFGLLPLQGLVEGAAVAADWQGGNLSGHEEARAMRALGLAPDLEKILSAIGFWTQPASRVYAYAGSFVRWLVDERGNEAFAKVYRDGDFQAAYGVSAKELIASWEAFLDAVPLSESSRTLAEAKFQRRSIFRTPCAREIASVSKEARDAFSAGDGVQAAALYQRIRELQGGNPSHLVDEAASWALAREPGKVLAIARKAEADKISQPLLSRLWTLAGDTLVKFGETTEAQEAYEKAASFTTGTDARRSLVVRREAAADPLLSRVVLPYLATGSDGDLLEIREILAKRQSWGIGWYLVGRRLYQRDHFEGAIRDLGRALEAGLPQELEREAKKVLALSRMAAEEYEGGCLALEDLAKEGTEGERLEAADLAGLCRSAQARKVQNPTAETPPAGK